MPQTLIHSWAH